MTLHSTSTSTWSMLRNEIICGHWYKIMGKQSHHNDNASNTKCNVQVCDKNVCNEKICKRMTHWTTSLTRINSTCKWRCKVINSLVYNHVDNNAKQQCIMCKRVTTIKSTVMQNNQWLCICTIPMVTTMTKQTFSLLQNLWNPPHND